jgi:ketosteroid isomerase-like protein
MFKSLKLKTPVILLFTFISMQQVFASQNSDFMEAIELLKNGKMDQAELILEKLSSKSEATPEIFNNLAVIAARKGKFKKAVSLLQVALSKNPSAKITYDNLNKIFSYQAAVAYRSALSDEQNKVETPVLELSNKIAVGIIKTQAAAPPQKCEEIKEKATPEPISCPKITEVQPQTNIAVNEITISGETILKEQSAIKESVVQWITAWSKKDISAYLNAYVDNYTPNNDVTNKNWKKTREYRIKSAKFIKIKLSRFKTELINNSFAIVRFHQLYTSNTFSDKIRKFLLMQKSTDGWKIMKEKVFL